MPVTRASMEVLVQTMDPYHSLVHVLLDILVTDVNYEVHIRFTYNYKFLFLVKIVPKYQKLVPKTDIRRTDE